MKLFFTLNGKDIEATTEEDVRLTLDWAAGIINQEEVTEC
jgi:hypothetical protein